MHSTHLACRKPCTLRGASWRFVATLPWFIDSHCAYVIPYRISIIAGITLVARGSLGRHRDMPSLLRPTLAYPLSSTPGSSTRPPLFPSIPVWRCTCRLAARHPYCHFADQLHSLALAHYGTRLRVHDLVSLASGRLPGYPSLLRSRRPHLYARVCCLALGLSPDFYRRLPWATRRATAPLRHCLVISSRSRSH